MLQTQHAFLAINVQRALTEAPTGRPAVVMA
jgi:hypothetical protein